MELKCIATGSTGNAYSLTDKNGDILILDAGISFKDIKIGIDFKVSKIKGVLCSHHHKDHSLSLNDFRKAGIPVIAPFIEQPNPMISLGSYFVRYFALTDNEGHFVHSNADGSECPIYGFFITSNIEAIRFLYITDCEFIKYRFKDITNVLIGINYSDETLAYEENEMKKRHVISGHLCIDTACDFIKVLDKDKTLKNVIVGHMSSTASDEGLFSEKLIRVTDSDIYFAHKGLVIDL